MFLWSYILENNNLIAIVLAAGRGSRMKSEVPKVLSLLNEKPIISYVIESLKNLDLKNLILVVGYKKELVMDYCSMYPFVEYVYQQEQRGTAHALLCCKKYLEKFEGLFLVAYGDMPFITKDSFEKLIETHKQTNLDITILSSYLENPSSYGRIIRNELGNVVAIIEEKDATEEQKQQKEVNTGTYVFNSKNFLYYLSKINPANVQKEYYLTDLVKIYFEEKLKVGAVCLSKSYESIGINSIEDLKRANQIIKDKI